MNDCIDISFVVEWFRVHCDEDWEHGEGVRIVTLDNPGWHITIDIEGTELCGVEEPWHKLEDSESEWIHWWSTGKKFEVACGVGDLGRGLATFEEFATRATRGTRTPDHEGG